MKTAIVPAQITTVEDKVAGNLSLQQLVLLVSPLFVGAGLYVLAPSTFGFETYKLVIVSIVALLCLLAAIRIKGTLMVYWIVRLSIYRLRPRLYTYQKADTYMRDMTLIEEQPLSEESELARVEEDTTRPRLVPGALQTLKLQYVASTEANYVIEKGGLHVRYEEK